MPLTYRNHDSPRSVAADTTGPFLAVAKSADFAHDVGEVSSSNSSHSFILEIAWNDVPF